MTPISLPISSTRSGSRSANLCTRPTPQHGAADPIHELPRTGHRHHRLQGGRVRRDGRLLALAYREYPLLSPAARLGGGRFGAGLPRLRCEVIREAAAASRGDPVRGNGHLLPGRGIHARRPPTASLLGNGMVSSDARARRRRGRVQPRVRSAAALRADGPYAASDVHALQAPVAAAAAARGLRGGPAVPLLRGPVPRSGWAWSRPSVGRWPGGRCSSTSARTSGTRRSSRRSTWSRRGWPGPCRRAAWWERFRTRWPAELGLPDDVIVVAGGHDQPCGALGAGVVEPGVAMYASGTVECICPAFDQPHFDERLFRANLCTYDYTLPGMYTTVLFSLTGGNLLRWFRDQWGQPEVAEAARTGRRSLRAADAGHGRRAHRSAGAALFHALGHALLRRPRCRARSSACGWARRAARCCGP